MVFSPDAVIISCSTCAICYFRLENESFNIRCNIYNHFITVYCHGSISLSSSVNIMNLDLNDGSFRSQDMFTYMVKQSGYAVRIFFPKMSTPRKSFCVAVSRSLKEPFITQQYKSLKVNSVYVFINTIVFTDYSIVLHFSKPFSSVTLQSIYYHICTKINIIYI